MGGAKWVRWHLFSLCLPFCGSNIAESLPLQGVLRDMCPQLLPEGNSHLSPPFIGGQVFPSFYVLLLGRILSGVSTSCLYSVFEVNLNKQLTESRRYTFDNYGMKPRRPFQSWYVAEHKSRGLPTETLSSTLALVADQIVLQKVEISY